MTSELPTPEQQEPTARRFRGQRALATPVVVQEATHGPQAPTTPSEAPRPTRGFRKAFWHWARRVTFWTLVGLIVSAVGAHQVNNHSDTGVVPAYPTMYPLAHEVAIVLAIALGVLVAFWLIVGMGAYLRLVWQTTGEAMKPVPSLAEIDQQLRAEGFDPSISDLVSMHGYLTGQRNAAALFAGALVIGPQVLARQAQGKPVL